MNMPEADIKYRMGSKEFHKNKIEWWREGRKAGLQDSYVEQAPAKSFLFLLMDQPYLQITFSVQFSLSVMSNSLRSHELQHARPPCPSPTPGVHSNARPSSKWCHPAISSSVVPFSSCPQSLPASESFPMSQLFTWGGKSIGVSALASFLPKNTQG